MNRKIYNRTRECDTCKIIHDLGYLTSCLNDNYKNIGVHCDYCIKELKDNVVIIPEYEEDCSCKNL